MLRTSPNETSPEIVAGLTRFQIARLKKLGKTGRGECRPSAGWWTSSAAIRSRWPSCWTGWSSRRRGRRWTTWRSGSRRQLPPSQACCTRLPRRMPSRGRRIGRRRRPARALRLYPGKQQKQLLHHLMVAQHLRQRGQFAWARREFEHVIAQGGDAENDELRVMAQSVSGRDAARPGPGPRRRRACWRSSSRPSTPAK